MESTKHYWEIDGISTKFENRKDIKRLIGKSQFDRMFTTGKIRHIVEPI